MIQPTKIQISERPPVLQHVTFANKKIHDKEEYERSLKDLQREMQKIQQAYFQQKKKAIIVFEGWDASGKGGAIRRLTEKLDPRGVSVIPIGVPTNEEKARHYMYRFYQHLPTEGHITIFDRSYYGRVLVERVESLATKTQWQRAYQEINEFERAQTDEGVKIIKLFLHIDKQEQLARFEQRLVRPEKRWKITQEDIRNHLKWSEYESAINSMFKHTSTIQNPWEIVPAKNKWFARIEVLASVAKRLSEGVNIEYPNVDPEVLKAAKEKLGLNI